jgi:RNA polymerase sigma-54 factor
MLMDLSQTPRVVFLQQTSPWLIAANAMLALSSADLASLLAQEVAQNPALELDERPVCPRCGRPLLGEGCPDCVRLSPASQFAEADDWQAEGSGQVSGYEEDPFDPLSLLGAPVDFRAQLCLALRAQLPSEEAPLIEYLVESLNDDGYLECALEDGAQLFRVPLERVEAVLAALQAQEPTGIGARTVRECLLLQLQACAEQGIRQPYAFEVLDQYLPWLGQHRYREIARALGCTLLQVEQVHGFLTRRLHPYPMRSALASTQPSPRPLLPDVRIQRQSEGGGYEVEVLEARRFRVQLSPAYTAAARTLETCSGAERQHIQVSLAQARLVLINLQRRWQTLARITAYLVERQRAFVEQGQAALQPLTQAEVGAALHLHASTVSRAMADKAVLLPTGQVVPFSTFCTTNLGVKAVLQALMRQAGRPLSDQQLREQLQARGITIARRTVAKYRESLGLRPAHARAHPAERRCPGAPGETPVATEHAGTPRRKDQG